MRVSKDGQFARKSAMAKETCPMAKETCPMAKKTYPMSKETYQDEQFARKILQESLRARHSAWEKTEECHSRQRDKELGRGGVRGVGLGREQTEHVLFL